MERGDEQRRAVAKRHMEEEAEEEDFEKARPQQVRDSIDEHHVSMEEDMNPGCHTISMPLGKRDKQPTPSRSPNRKRSPSRSPSRARSCLEVLDLTQSIKKNKVKKERNEKEQKTKPNVNDVIDLCDSD